MTLLSRALPLATLASLFACGGDQPASCELEVSGTSICIEGEMSVAFCEDDAGGVGVDRDESTCADLGYTVECPGKVEQQGEDTTASLPYSAATEEDCDAAEGGTFQT